MSPRNLTKVSISCLDQSCGMDINPYRVDGIFGILVRVLWNEFRAKFFRMSRMDSTL